MIRGTQWLEVDYRTLFLLRDDGRIERENDPDRSPGPRFWLAGCSERNVFGVRVDVPDEINVELEALAVDEPPFRHPDTPPRHFDRYAALLARHAPVTRSNFGLIYELPHSLRYESGARLVSSDSEEGQNFARSLAEQGMPQGLSQLGFRDVGDLWSPWCVALVDGEIASIAFASRLSKVGAELGVATATSFRGRGFAAAATAGWSSLPSLQSRILFYSTSWENLSSQKVAMRLGLRLRGASIRIS